MEICGHALQPAGIILLVIGAGGVFETGTGCPASARRWAALTVWDCRLPLPALLALAAAVRIIQGSATVACLTAVGRRWKCRSPEQLNFSGAQMAALSI